MKIGTVFATRAETGCISTSEPDAFGNFTALDSDGVECAFHTGMITRRIIAMPDGGVLTTFQRIINGTHYIFDQSDYRGERVINVRAVYTGEIRHHLRYPIPA